MVDFVLIGESFFSPGSYGHATRYLAYKLKEMGYSVVVEGLNMIGKFEKDGIIWENLREPRKIYYYYKPRYAIIIGAPFTEPMKNYIISEDYKQFTKHVKVAGYFIHEGEELSPFIESLFYHVHLYVTNNEYATTLLPIPESRYAVVRHVVEFDKIEKYKDNKPTVDFIAIMSNHWRKRIDLYIKLLFVTDKSGILKTDTRNNYWVIDSIIYYYNRYYLKNINFIKIDDDLDDDEIYKLQSSAKVTFHVTNGESFAYPILQSLILERPVLATAHPMLLSTYTEDTVTFVKSEPFLGNDGMVYRNPDFDDLVKKTLDIFDHYDEYVERIRKSKDLLKMNYDYTSKFFEDEIKEMINKLEKQDRLIADDMFMNFGDISVE